MWRSWIVKWKREILIGIGGENITRQLALRNAETVLRTTGCIEQYYKDALKHRHAWVAIEK